LTSSFQSNLTQEQKTSLGFTQADYGFSDFRNDVDTCLRAYYGANNVSLGNKVIKIIHFHLYANIDNSILILMV